MTWFWNRIAVWYSLHESIRISELSHGSVFESPAHRVHNGTTLNLLLPPVTKFELYKRVRIQLQYKWIQTHPYLYPYIYIHGERGKSVYVATHIPMDTYTVNYTHTLTLTHTHIPLHALMHSTHNIHTITNNTPIYIFTNVPHIIIHTHSRKHHTHACIHTNKHTTLHINNHTHKNTTHTYNYTPTWKYFRVKKA